VGWALACSDAQLLRWREISGNSSTSWPLAAARDGELKTIRENVGLRQIGFPLQLPGLMPSLDW
jgi:hypothetical protein